MTERIEALAAEMAAADSAVALTGADTDYCDSVRQWGQRIAVSCSTTVQLLRRGGTESQ